MCNDHICYFFSDTQHKLGDIAPDVNISYVQNSSAHSYKQARKQPQINSAAYNSFTRHSQYVHETAYSGSTEVDMQHLHIPVLVDL